MFTAHKKVQQNLLKTETDWKNVPYSIYLWKKYQNLLHFSNPHRKLLEFDLIFKLLEFDLIFYSTLLHWFQLCSCYLFHIKFYFCLVWNRYGNFTCHVCKWVDKKSNELKHCWCFCLRFEFSFFMACFVIWSHFQKVAKRKLKRTLWMAMAYLKVLFNLIISSK